MTLLPINNSHVDTQPLMRAHELTHPALPVEIRVSAYEPEQACAEYHLTLTPTAYAPVEKQLRWLEEAYVWTLDQIDLNTSSAVLRRIFSSDPVNQRDALNASPLCQTGHDDNACAISITGQAPAGIAKVALWAYHLKPHSEPLNKEIGELGLCIQRGPLTHHWTTQVSRPEEEDSYDETWHMLKDYSTALSEEGMSVADHVLRTWFMVRDVDVNYMGLVHARRELFDQWGLNAKTHYLASTGIGAEGLHTNKIVHMDAYAVNGIDQEHIEYLKALDHLSPTHIYGVTFERATAVSYQDRKQVFISGTASIDHQGEVVHRGNVLKQLDRTLENIEALLDEAGGDLKDMSHFLVYLRDLSDAEAIRAAISRRIDATPMVILLAPVCRPGWLIEIEGMATLSSVNPECPEF